MSCDLYFDGLPAGTSQVELEFFWQEVGTQQEEVLASFTLDLANQEITAAGTQGVEQGSTQYSLLETGDTGWEENGFTVKDVWFSQAEGYTGHAYFYVPDDCLETNLQVEVQNAQGETLFRSQAYGEDGAPVVTPEGTPVKVYMKYTLKNGLRRIVLRTPDGIGLDVSDEEAEACLRASTQKERREYARLDDEHRKGL
jgi:hypothetical protein